MLTPGDTHRQRCVQEGGPGSLWTRGRGALGNVGWCPGHCPLSVGRQLLPISFPSGLLLRLQNIPERGRGLALCPRGSCVWAWGLRKGGLTQSRGSQGNPSPRRARRVCRDWRKCRGGCSSRGSPRSRSPHVHHRALGDGPCGVSRPLNGRGLSGAPCPPRGWAAAGSHPGHSEATAAQPVPPIPPSASSRAVQRGHRHT